MLATVVFTAVNIPSQKQEVTTPDELQTALADADTDVVTLRGEMTLSEPLELTGETRKVIDLNGYALNSSGVSVTDGANLTVMNGTLTAENTNTAFTTSGGDLVLSGVTAAGFARLIENNEALGQSSTPSTIRITNCTADTSNVTVMIRGIGVEAEGSTKLIIEGSRLTSGYIAISGNGNLESGGTEIVISNSVIDGYYSALYQPQQRANTTIVDSTLTGWTGIAVKGGSVTIENSTIRGIGAYNEAKNALSGFTDTGDGVYVEAGYNCSATVIIKGSETVVNSVYGYAVQLFGVENMGPGRVVIHNGNFTVGAEAKGSYRWNEIGTFERLGGAYTTAVPETPATPTT